MRLEAAKLLLDIRMALQDIRLFTEGMDLGAYQASAICRAAVERKFEVIGEACTRLKIRCPEFFERISSAPQIIGFRNRLIHGYDQIDDGIVWDVVTRRLPELEIEISRISIVDEI